MVVRSDAACLLVAICQEAVPIETRAGVSSAVAKGRVLLAAAALPVLVGYVGVAAVLAAVAAAADLSYFSGTGAVIAAAPGWLAAYQVPVSIQSQELGVLPLTATLAVCVLVGKVAQRAAARLEHTHPSHSLVVIGVIACAHGLAGLAIAITIPPGSVEVDSLAAAVVPALLAGLSATLGVARGCGLYTYVRGYIGDAAAAGIRAGILGLVGLLAAGGLVLTIAAAISAVRMAEMFASHVPDVGSGFGMLMLSIGYLPNAVLATLAFIVGPGFSLGSVSVNPFGMSGGALPPVPLFAAMPEGHVDWWAAFFVLPAAVGVLVGLMLRRSSAQPLVRLRSVGVVGVCAGFGCLVLVSAAGGRLGEGQFEAVIVPAGAVSLSAVGWLVAPAAIVVWFGGPRPDRSGESAAADPVDDHEAEYEPVSTDHEAMVDHVDGSADGGQDASDEVSGSGGDVAEEESPAGEPAGSSLLDASHEDNDPRAGTVDAEHEASADDEPLAPCSEEHEEARSVHE